MSPETVYLSNKQQTSEPIWNVARNREKKAKFPDITKNKSNKLHHLFPAQIGKKITTTKTMEAVLGYVSTI